jgi:hypothetical protein
MPEYDGITKCSGVNCGRSWSSVMTILATCSVVVEVCPIAVALVMEDGTPLIVKFECADSGVNAIYAFATIKFRRKNRISSPAFNLPAIVTDTEILTPEFGTLGDMVNVEFLTLPTARSAVMVP